MSRGRVCMKKLRILLCWCFAVATVQGDPTVLFDPTTFQQQDREHVEKVVVHVGSIFLGLWQWVRPSNLCLMISAPRCGLMASQALEFSIFSMQASDPLYQVRHHYNANANESLISQLPTSNVPASACICLVLHSDWDSASRFGTRLTSSSAILVAFLFWSRVVFSVRRPNAPHCGLAVCQQPSFQ